MEKYALITGACSGLGKEFAKLYAKEGNNLLLIGTNLDRLNSTKFELNKLYPSIHIDTYLCDLSKQDQYEGILKYTKSKEYFINVLINSAGFGDRCDFIEMDVNKQLDINNVNCNALLYLTRVYIDDMVKFNEGRIINVSSIAGFVPGPYMCTYHASKAYVLLLTESIAYELRKTKIKITCLCPGPFKSGFVARAHNDFTFSKIKPIDASEVALVGYKANIKNKTIQVVGAKNRLTVFAPRFFSRHFVAASSAKTMKKDI